MKIRITDKAVRVHRDTCMRVPAAKVIATDELLDKGAAVLEAVPMAQPAACCKPRPEDVQRLIDAVAQGREDELAGTTRKTTEESESGYTTYVSTGMDRRYWKVVGREAAKRVAETHGVEVQLAPTGATFTGEASSVKNAVTTLHAFWGETAQAFAEWRRANSGAWIESEFEFLRSLIDQGL